MLQKVLIGPLGAKFLKDCKEANRAVFLWTVNDEEWMRWSIKKEVDGVITDDPKKYLEVCEDYDESVPLRRLPLKEVGYFVWLNVLVLSFSIIFRYRYGFRIDASKLMKIEDSKSTRDMA
jgi:phosphatidylglycerol phospholipase C